MKFEWALVMILLVCCNSCESDPRIDMETQPIPYCYAVFDSKDFIHDIIVMKTFHGNPYGPCYNSKIFDSIYFSDAQVDLTLMYYYGIGFPTQFDTLRLSAEKVLGENKLPGIFNYPVFQKFVFSKNLTDCAKIQATIKTNVDEPMILTTGLIKSPTLNYPKSSGSTIELTKTTPLRISWKGNTWNEVTIRLIVFSKTEESDQTDTLRFFKKGFSTPDDPNGMGFETVFPYYSFLAVLNSQIENSRNVIYRKFIDIQIEITCSTGAFKSYMDNLSVLSDEVVSSLNSKPLSLFTSKSSSSVSGLHFSQESIDSMKSDPEITKFKFVFW